MIDLEKSILSNAGTMVSFLPPANFLWILIILTILFESATLFLRFKFGLRGKDYRLHIGGLPMHHFILGFVGVLFSVFIFKNNFLLTAAWALIISDLIHHLILAIYAKLH